MRKLIWLAAFAVACGGDKSDSGAEEGYAPDITGKYNVEVLGVAGCENDPSWLDAWARGPLRISGTSDSLSWDFGEDVVFSGLVESDSGFRFSGSLTVNGAALSVTSTGLASLAPTDPGDGSQSLLEGTISVVVEQEGQEACTIEGPFEATELVDFE
jgi:hypothetical protein